MARFGRTQARRSRLSSTPLIDTPQARAARARAARAGEGHFLLDHVADDIAARVQAVNRRFARILDLSARPGVVLARLEAAGPVVSASSVPHPPPNGSPGLVADPEWCPFAPGSFDLIVSGLLLHAANDLPGALIQLNRALSPDGMMVASLFGGETLTELRQAFTQAESEVSGGVSPRVLPFCDVREAGALLQRAGFALPVADADRLTVRYETPIDLMHDLRRIGETNALAQRTRSTLRRDVLKRMMEIYAGRFADPDGRIRATFEIITLTGWHPHESQQKPLAPGSATTRLADTLGTAEQSSGEVATPSRGDRD